jgi:hypothetical protein
MILLIFLLQTSLKRGWHISFWRSAQAKTTKFLIHAHILRWIDLIYSRLLTLTLNFLL